jgi:integrase
MTVAIQENNETSSHKVTKYRSKYTCYEKFIHSIYSNATKKVYTRYLKFFMRFCGFDRFEQLLEISDSDKFDSISDFLIYLREERKIGNGSIKTNYAAIKKFFQVNNVHLQWDQLNGYKGKSNGKLIDDRVYTKDEIVKLLDHADLRMKVIVLTLLSTGMRVGGLAELKVKDLEYIEKYGIYKITVYSYDLTDKYVTFCTPECADAIKKYLKYREEIGDTINLGSPLIYRKITRVRYGGTKREISVTNLFYEHVTSDSLQQSVSRLQRKSMIVSIEKEKDHSKRSRIRKEMMRCHAFRKIFDTRCIENNVNHYVKEKLLGHKAKLGLEVNYFRPTETHLLSEYLKVIDDLTINDENRLSKQVQELKEKSKDKDYVINGKRQEKESEIQIMKQQIQMLRESQKEILECLKYPSKLNQILNEQ